MLLRKRPNMSEDYVKTPHVKFLDKCAQQKPRRRRPVRPAHLPPLPVDRRALFLLPLFPAHRLRPLLPRRGPLQVPVQHPQRHFQGLRQEVLSVLRPPLLQRAAQEVRAQALDLLLLHRSLTRTPATASPATTATSTSASSSSSSASGGSPPTSRRTPPSKRSSNSSSAAKRPPSASKGSPPPPPRSPSASSPTRPPPPATTCPGSSAGCRRAAWTPSSDSGVVWCGCSSWSTSSASGRPASRRFCGPCLINPFFCDVWGI